MSDEIQELKDMVKGLQNRVNILNKQLILNKPPVYKTPKSYILFQEYLNNEDLDDNKLIYGYDFKFKSDLSNH